MNNNDKNFIFGIRPIIEAIEAGKTIDKLFIQKGLHNDSFAELWKLVRLRRINYKHVPIEKIPSPICLPLHPFCIFCFMGFGV